jgi:AAA15 family ATPase/GTPase
MLIRFSVENYRSFRDRVELSMIPGPIQRHPGHVVRPSTSDGIPLLKTAILYGANASGKSNLVQALYNAQRIILRPVEALGRLPIHPFKLDAESRGKPSRFEFEMKIHGRYFAYGFAATAERVEEEWLYEIGGGSESCVFERSGAQIQFGNIPFNNTEEKQFLQFTAKGTLSNRLFLTECRERNVQSNVGSATVLFDVLGWFANVLTVIFPEYSRWGFDVSVEGNEFMENLTRLLRAFDTGIEAVSLKEYPEDQARLSEVDKLRVAEAIDKHARVIVPVSPTLRWLVDRDDQGRLRARRLVFRHGAGAGGADALFEMSEESDGTRRLMDLVPALMLLVESDRVFVIDEFDRSLHPDVSHSLIDNFLRYSEGRESQLIVTTHETSLMDQRFLRRDEIWMVEKGQDQSTRLIALEEYQGVPEDADLQRDYLNGRFGGVPVLRDFTWMGRRHAEGT